MSVVRTFFVAAIAAITSKAGAQRQIELSPLLGYYRPLGNFDPASIYSTALPERPQDLAGVAFGGELSALWSRFGVGIRGATVHTYLAEPPHPTPSGGGRFGDTPARVTVFAAEALYRIPGTRRRPEIRIGGGPAWIQHGARAYEDYGSPSQAAVSVSARASWRTRAHVRPFLGTSLTRYLFDVPMPPEWRLNPGSIERGVQVDALFHAGASWRP
jgi:hypothetical protein